MRNILFSISTVILICSCQQTNEVDCELIKEIVKKDQFYRQKHANIISPFFFTLDTLLKSDGYPEGIDELSSYDSEVVRLKRELARNIVDTRPDPNPNTLDSIWALQNEQDELNTLQMIEMIEKFGLKALDSLQNGCAMEAFIVFVHSPDHLKSKVQEVIDPELIEIDEYRHRHIMWHIEGRN